MLAGIGDYVLPALHFPLLLVFLGGWLLGGGYLLARSMRKQLPRRQSNLGRCVLAMLLTQMAAGFAAVVALYTYWVFLSPERPATAIPALLPAALLGLLVGYREYLTARS